MNSPSSSTSTPENLPGAEQLAQDILGIIAAGRRCQRKVQGALQSLPVSDSQLLVLWMVYQLAPLESGLGVGQSELVRCLGISAAQVSGLVDQLRRSGDLVGTRVEQDRRQQRWHLTAGGNSKLAQGLESIAVIGKSLLAECLPSEIQDSQRDTSGSLTSVVSSPAHGEAA